MKKITITTIIVMFFINTVLSQKIEMKNDIIRVDGTDLLSYKISNYDYELSIYKLNTKKEIIFIMYNNNQTPGSASNGDDYYIISFLEQNIKMETHNWSSHWKDTIKWFIENNLFNSEGDIDSEKLKLFITKYSENISGKLK